MLLECLFFQLLTLACVMARHFAPEMVKVTEGCHDVVSICKAAGAQQLLD